jgi:hypothetical protein
MWVLYIKLNKEQAELVINQAEAFFKDNPNQSVCSTDIYPIRRGFVRTDVMKHTLKED